ncbi:MAG TPA: hypothetical protein PLB02_06625 [Thermoanaerobaculia bacterium]|nr:hypothetical protein [Thermoanaerobaculia bacterium]
MPRKRPPCPKCGSPDVAEIVYGLVQPDERMNAAARRGEITYGGCCVSDDDPEWHCNACGKDFGRQGSGRSGDDD